MTAFDAVLHEIFVQSAERRLTREEEREMIAGAQFGGEAETLALLYAYAPVLRNLVAQHAQRIGVEEARSAAVSGLLEAIHAFDLATHDGQLAGIAHNFVSNSLRAVASTAMPIESRTLRRYLGAMKAADGDFSAALKILPEIGMTRATFVAVHEALAADHLTDEPRQIDRATPVWAPSSSDAFADADDVALVDRAFAVVHGLQEDVIRHAYGFETGDPMSDAEVAEAISIRDLGPAAVSGGQSVASRATVQRARSKGLAEMRKAVVAEGIA